jgi:hypothetical protein
MNAIEEDPSWLNQRITNMRVSNSMRNVFHPNDPVAYRLEPLLVPCQHQKTAAKVLLPPQPPVFIHTISGDDRLQVKWQKAQMEFSKFWGGGRGGNDDGSDGASGAAEAKDKISSVASKLSNNNFCSTCFEARIPQRGMPPSNLASFDDSTGIQGEDAKAKAEVTEAMPWMRGEDAKAKAEAAEAMQRKLHEIYRIDFVLQVNELELSMSEYLSALQAHGCYFESPDVIKFILDTVDGERCPALRSEG